MTDNEHATRRRRGGQPSRYEEIVTGARELFRKTSIDDITTRELAEHLGVGEATLFRHVTSKSHLLALVYRDEMDALLDLIDEEDARLRVALAGSRDDERADPAFITRTLNIYEMRSQFFRAHPANGARYLQEGFSMQGTEWKRNLQQARRTLALIESVITHGKSDGSVIANISSEDVALNCHAIFMHEVQRGPLNDFDPDSIWVRTEPRLRAQLEPLSSRRET